MDRPCLRVVDLDMRIGDRLILKDISFEAPIGAWTSIIGANAAGKTTLLQSIAGWRKLAGGAIRTPHNLTSFRAKVEIVLTPVPEALPKHLLGRELIDIVSRERDRALGSDWHAVAQQLDGAEWLGRPLGELSWGTKKKVCLAVSLCTKPMIILLDEAFDGLDALSSARIRALFHKMIEVDGLTLISATHNWESVFADSDQIVFLAAGKITKILQKDEFRDLTAESIRMQNTVLRAFGSAAAANATQEAAE